MSTAEYAENPKKGGASVAKQTGEKRSDHPTPSPTAGHTGKSNKLSGAALTIVSTDFLTAPAVPLTTVSGNDQHGDPHPDATKAQRGPESVALTDLVSHQPTASAQHNSIASWLNTTGAQPESQGVNLEELYQPFDKNGDEIRAAPEDHRDPEDAALSRSLSRSNSDVEPAEVYTVKEAAEEAAAYPHLKMEMKSHARLPSVLLTLSFDPDLKRKAQTGVDHE